MAAAVNGAGRPHGAAAVWQLGCREFAYVVVVSCRCICKDIKQMNAYLVDYHRRCDFAASRELTVGKTMHKHSLQAESSRRH